MEKFGMSFGGGPSRKELLDTVEAQKKQLVQYQTRFKDVVRAYKSLLKEKEALEASLKVLSVTHEEDSELHGLVANAANGSAAELPDEGCSVHSEDSLETAASADTASETARGEQSEDDQGEPVLRSEKMEVDASSTGSSGSVGAEPPQQAVANAEADRRVAQLKSQLSTLTGALATVTQEKSRMEANFQADKRQLKQEVEELQGRVLAGASQQEAELRAMQQQLAESRARVITQQHDREQEQVDHVQQLRELQRLLQQERDLRQDAELHLQDTSAALLETTQVADREIEYEAQLKHLREEREELKRRLQVAVEDQKKPDPRLEELQQELSQTKEHLQRQIQVEIKKACEVEERARDRAQVAEVRVAGLEQRINELSELLGSCEKARQRDQQAAQRLRDRILQLDTENKTLAIAASNRSATADLHIDETQLDVVALKEKLEKVKKLLLIATQRHPDKIIQDLQEMEPESGGDRASALGCQQELRQLKDEFERYKLRAQVVLKNKNTKDGCQAKELEEMRDQLSELKEKYISLRIQSDEAKAQHCHELEERQQGAAALQQGHRQELERAEALHREGLGRLEAEMHKQRERTMALLDEKDQELEKLRAVVLGRPNDYHDAADDSHQPETEGDIVGLALQRVTSSEPTLLLYAEQLARKEVEVGGLRRQKNRLEEDLHQLQARLIANGERHEEETVELRAKLDKVARDQSREGANLEYLKNVIYKFLTLQDASGRHQTLTAILTILHFSPQEKHHVLLLQVPSWWAHKR